MHLPGRIDRADVWQYWFYMAATSQVQKNLQAAMREALRIQNRFSAEPLFAKTGRGSLKSEGVSTLQKIKSRPQALGILTEPRTDLA